MVPASSIDLEHVQQPPRLIGLNLPISIQSHRVKLNFMFPMVWCGGGQKLPYILLSAPETAALMSEGYHASDVKASGRSSSSGGSAPAYKDRGGRSGGGSGSYQGSGSSGRGLPRRGSSNSSSGSRDRERDRDRDRDRERDRERDRDGRSRPRSRSRDGGSGGRERRNSGGSRSPFGASGSPALRLRERKNLLTMHRTGARRTDLSPAEAATRVIGMDTKYMKARLIRAWQKCVVGF